MRLRPSRLGIAFACPASLSLPEVERLSDAADAGKKRHAWLAKHPEVGVEALGGSRGAPMRIEAEVGFQGIKGTADLVLSWDPDGPLVADYKTAGQDKGDPAESPQLLLYACATSASQVAFIYVDDSGPDGECRVVSVRRSPVTPEMREAFAAKLARLQSASPRFATGPHCTFCPSATVCPALRDQVEVVLADHALTLTPEMAGAAWERLKAVRAACDMAEEAVRALVAQGPIPLPSGGTIQEVEVAKESIDAEKAVKLLPYLPVKLSIAKSSVSTEQLVQLRRAGCTKTSFSHVVRAVRGTP